MNFSIKTFKQFPPMLRGPAVSPRMQSIGAALLSGGIAECLATLNAGVPHRYSAVFRLYRDLLQNTHMFDKRGELRPQALEVVILKDSFCQIVLREGFLLTEDASKEARLDYSPFQAMVLAYHGVPIVTPEGELWGSLCHFDMTPQALSDDEFFCLRETATLLSSVIG